MQQYSRNEISTRTVQIRLGRGLEENASASGEDFEGACARMGVPEPAVATRQTNTAGRRQFNVRQNFRVVGSWERSEPECPVRLAVASLGELREAQLRAKASTEDEIVRHSGSEAGSQWGEMT